MSKREEAEECGTFIIFAIGIAVLWSFCNSNTATAKQKSDWEISTKTQPVANSSLGHAYTIGLEKHKDLAKPILWVFCSGIVRIDYKEPGIDSLTDEEYASELNWSPMSTTITFDDGTKIIKKENDGAYGMHQQSLILALPVFGHELRNQIESKSGKMVVEVKTSVGPRKLVFSLAGAKRFIRKVANRKWPLRSTTTCESFYAKSWGKVMSKQEREQKKSEDAFARAFAKFRKTPCRSPLYFEKLLGTWRVIAPDAGVAYVWSVYPNDYNKIERALEQIGAGDAVSMNDFQRILGRCP